MSSSRVCRMAVGVTRLGAVLGMLLAVTGCQTRPGSAGSASPPESRPDYVVSPSGNDAWSGTLLKPNEAGTDGPFATLQRARDEVRKRKAAGPLPTGGLRVCVHTGRYGLEHSIEFGPQDSGSAEAPIVYTADGPWVSFLGGKAISGWVPVTDPAILERLDPAVRGQVRQADLRAAGVKDFGTVAGPARAELVCNRRYMTLARYPDPGEWMRIAAVPQTGEKAYENEKVVHYGRFTYDGDRPARWRDPSDLWVHGYWVHDWSDQYHRIQRLDLERKEIWPEPPYHGYGYKQGQRFHVLNALEELDQPGEWYLDRTRGIVYWLPDYGMVHNTRSPPPVLFPELQQPMLVLTNAEHVRFEGMTFECSRAGAILVKGGTAVEIVGCTIRNVGDTAIDIQGGTRHLVRSCDIYEVASTGISLNGGDRKTLARGDHAIENCHIHHFARVQKTYHPAVQLNGVGQRISHCYIHDGPHEGIGYGGNDHLIEYTEFTRIAQETGDVGVTYAAADWTFLGHEFRYNYFHGIHGPGSLGCFTIYPDLPCGGIYLHGNVFYDVDQVFHTNSGRGMVVENNVFLKCKGLSFSAWGDATMFQEGGVWGMVESLKAVNYDQPPYSTRYPLLQRLAADFRSDADQFLQRRLPKDNILRRNVSWGEFFLRLDPKASLEDVRVEDNVIAADIVFQGSFDGSGTAVTYRNGDPEVAAELGKRGNVVVAGDPGFGGLLTQDFALVPGSPAAQVGFERIPFAQIGLVRDRFQGPSVDVCPPALSPASRTFLPPLQVTLTPTPRPGIAKSVIRYTLDGSEPNPRSPVYHRPLTIRGSVTLKATAFQAVGRGRGSRRSETVTATYSAMSLAKGGVFLSDLQEQDLVTYMPCWRKDTNHLGRPIHLGGVEHAKGILLHPEEGRGGNRAQVTYRLGGELRQATRFSAVIGIDDAMHEYGKGSASFAVEVCRAGTWERCFESAVLKLGDAPQPVSVDLAGAEALRLVSADGGDGIACDHATWADPRLE